MPGFIATIEHRVIHQELCEQGRAKASVKERSSWRALTGNGRRVHPALNAHCTNHKLSSLVSFATDDEEELGGFVPIYFLKMLLSSWDCTSPLDREEVGPHSTVLPSHCRLLWVLRSSAALSRSRHQCTCDRTTTYADQQPSSSFSTSHFPLSRAIFRNPQIIGALITKCNVFQKMTNSY